MPEVAKQESILGGETVVPKSKTAAAQASATFQEKRFEVQEDIEVPRGASSFKLRKGQAISNAGYDIAALQRVGVKLREV